MIFFQSFVPSSNRFFKSFIGLYKNLFIVERNFYSEAFLMNIDVFQSGILVVASLVHLVLSAGAVSQVALSIIQSVVIYMVANQTLRCVHDKTSHINRFSFRRRCPANSIKRLGYWAPCRRPFELIDALKVFVIDEGKLSLRQRYLLHGLPFSMLRGCRQVGEFIGMLWKVFCQLCVFIGCFDKAQAVILEIGFNDHPRQTFVGKDGFRQGLHGGFGFGLAAGVAFAGGGTNVGGKKIRHGGTPYGVVDSAVRLIELGQTVVVAGSRRWFRAYRAFLRSLGSSSLGIYLLFAHFEALTSGILNQRKDNFSVQTSVISLRAFCKSIVKAFKNTEGKFSHTRSITASCRHCQGVNQAVSVATGTGRGRRRNVYHAW